MNGTLFWDREGNPIEDTIDWAKKFEDPEYRIVAVDQDFPGGPMVSTIWQGIDLARNFDDSIPPQIYETALLLPKEGNPDEANITQSYYSATEEEARHAHQRLCEDFLNRDAAPNDGHKGEIVAREKREKQ